jgi:ankyrin repeat protein
MLRRASLLVVCVLALPLCAAEREPGTAFAIAIERHDVDAIKALLASGLSTETPIDYGEHKITPLLKAAWDGDEQIVATLLGAGAKVNAKATDTGKLR